MKLHWYQAEGLPCCWPASSYLFLQILNFGFLLFQSELQALNYLLHLLVLLLLPLQNRLDLKNERKANNVQKNKVF